MKPVIWLPAFSALALILTGCANNDPTVADSGPGFGPFDKDGNYVDAWADDPSKWSRPGSRKPKPPADDLPVITKNEQPPAHANPLAPQLAANPKPAPKIESQPRETTRPTTTPKVVEKPKPKPKPVLVKAKPKPKPKVTRHVVKKGDTLSAIASRYGSSVSGIQRANGISGTLIRPGQSLVVPKR